VTVLDDYSGFGQRMSGSGTSVFTDVEVDPAEVMSIQPSASTSVGRTGFVQLVHLATLAGIVRRATDDIAGFMRNRRRSYAQGSADLPREDPLVQTVVIDLALRATTEIFEVGGASALDESLRLDRHWRNARTLASHNPAIYRARIVGDYLVNGRVPNYVASVGEAPSLASAPDAD
jgi:alkylation response protein AidB-like acyl-CoA dehydrogenase